jgi:hypothetical protein
METDTTPTTGQQEPWVSHHNKKGRVWGGLIIVLVGIALLARKMGAAVPEWLFTWEILMITIGLYMGVRHSFRGPGWLIVMLIGIIFLLDDITPELNIRPYFWPILLIGAGLFMMLRPSRRCGPDGRKRWRPYPPSPGQSPAAAEDMMDTVSVFGGVKKNVISKDFKGGEITCVFGGAEINLSQSDIHGRVTLELTQLFGGTRLVIPPHWRVQSELVAVLGGIEDHRTANGAVDDSKVLVLKGTSIFGGIDIKSF